MGSRSSEDCATCYINNILACYSALAQLPSLKPSPEVDEAFGKIVALCGDFPREIVSEKVGVMPFLETTRRLNLREQVLADPRIVSILPNLRQICACGESELEKHWADKICCRKTQNEAQETLLDFPYHDNYVDLVRMELSALAAALPHLNPRSFAFLGSGPLPLSSLCILRALDKASGSRITCHNIDCDEEAIATSRMVCSALGHTKHTMCFQCSQADNIAVELNTFDVVYLAALVGTDSEDKLKVLAATLKRMRPGTAVMIRSAHSLRRLLYPAIDVSHELVLLGLIPLLVLHPYNNIINSVVIAVVKDRLGACQGVDVRSSYQGQRSFKQIGRTAKGVSFSIVESDDSNAVYKKSVANEIFRAKEELGGGVDSGSS